jgi:hypothetical protein
LACLPEAGATMAWRVAVVVSRQRCGGADGVDVVARGGG